MSVIVSDVGGSCQSVDALGWIQKRLEVVEKSAGLACFSRASYGSSGDREVPGNALGAFPHRDCKAVRDSRHVQRLRAGSWGRGGDLWRQGEKGEGEVSLS